MFDGVTRRRSRVAPRSFDMIRDHVSRTERQRGQRVTGEAVEPVAPQLIVQKFGGSSLGEASRIRRVAQRIARARATGADLVVVVSAMGDTTDELLQLAAAITED